MTYQYAIKIEPKWLTTEHVKIPIKNLPSGLKGFKIVQLSDLHYYPHTPLSLIQKAVKRVNNLKPDIIALTGDYIDREAEPILRLMPILAKLKAKYGVFAIQGNHDNSKIVKTALSETSNISLLLNQGVNLNVGQANIFLAGLTPNSSGNLSLALKNHSPNIPVVLLVHEPDLADDYAKDKRITLQLSGHTHGGQVRIPFIGALVLPYLGHKYDHGLYKIKQMWLYTTRGIGVIGPPFGPPVRFNCPPEITEITFY
ncbi:metallophosphoesterase [Candidatus Halobeggiatoa sp. HSG11]|nr:metallophosphoesterase [Candidatus Halobeggiatoa sp. HSG11]